MARPAGVLRAVAAGLALAACGPSAAPEVEGSATGAETEASDSDADTGGGGGGSGNADGAGNPGDGTDAGGEATGANDPDETTAAGDQATSGELRQSRTQMCLDACALRDPRNGCPVGWFDCNDAGDQAAYCPPGDSPLWDDPFGPTSAVAWCEYYCEAAAVRWPDALVDAALQCVQSDAQCFVGMQQCICSEPAPGDCPAG